MSILNRFKEGECVVTTPRHFLCIEFILRHAGSALLLRHGFHTSQLLHYRLEQNDDEGKDTPPEKLMLAFATADVTLTGWRLDKLCGDLRDGELVAVRALPSRYADLDRVKTYVADITVTPLQKG